VKIDESGRLDSFVSLVSFISLLCFFGFCSIGEVPAWLRIDGLLGRQSATGSIAILDRYQRRGQGPQNARISVKAR
jgi:hypothetical protein